MAEIPLQTCPRCLGPLPAIKGSRLAVCRRCGYKDDVLLGEESQDAGFRTC